MAGYLEGYDAGGDRRDKIIRSIVIGAVAVLIVGTALYFEFRNYKEEQQVKQFLAELGKKNYQGAYSYWGCTPDHPCPQYAFDKFLEDWGPKSPHANIQEAKLARIKSCDNGIIEFLHFPGQEEVTLWVNRKDKSVGFAPWPVCNPRMPAP